MNLYMITIRQEDGTLEILYGEASSLHDAVTKVLANSAVKNLKSPEITQASLCGKKSF